MSNTELSKLEPVVILFKRVDKKDKANNVEAVGEKAVMHSKWEQQIANHNMVFEVVNNGFTLEIVDCGGEEVPVEWPDPRQFHFTGGLSRKHDNLSKRKDLD